MLKWCFELLLYDLSKPDRDVLSSRLIHSRLDHPLSINVIHIPGLAIHQPVNPLIVLSALNYLTQSPCPINLLSLTLTSACFHMTADCFKRPQFSFGIFSFESLSLLINAESPPLCVCVLVNTATVKQTYFVFLKAGGLDNTKLEHDLKLNSWITSSTHFQDKGHKGIYVWDKLDNCGWKVQNILVFSIAHL